MSNKAHEAAERLRKNWAAPMSEAEVAFLRDMQGFIEFAMRNGLTFPTVMAAVVQDVNEIARDGFDFTKAKSRGFQPKVGGYGQISEEDVDGSEETDE